MFKIRNFVPQARRFCFKDMFTGKLAKTLIKKIYVFIYFFAISTDLLVTLYNKDVLVNN